MPLVEILQRFTAWCSGGKVGSRSANVQRSILRIASARFASYTKRQTAVIVCIVASLAYQSFPASAAPSATEIVERAENILWGQTLTADYEMTITTPTWSRTLMLQVRMDRPEKKSFVRITAPAKDAGIASLRIASEMWNYIPSIERTVKIPPSMMLQPWLGSDFTNDDLVKESSILNDYTHRVISEKEIDGNDAYQIEVIPKPNAAVVWGKIIYSIRKNDFVPLKEEFYDERGELIRVLIYSNFRAMGGRTIPTQWEMQPLNKVGKRTTVIVKSASYDKPISADIFSLRNLNKKD
ncbi:MAG: outer membrane lipoprotein-sorting protein [Pseudomonadota bacterium]